MSTANMEVMVKTLDKRVAAIERTLETLNTFVKTAPDFAAKAKDVSGLAVRIDNLEKLVKTLVATRGDSKAVALDKLEKTVQDMVTENRKKDHDMHVAMQKSLFVRMPDMRKVLDEEISRVKALQTTAAEALFTRQKADADKLMTAKVEQEKKSRESAIAQMLAASKEHVTKMQLETQFKVLEARLMVLEKTR